MDRFHLDAWSHKYMDSETHDCPQDKAGAVQAAVKLAQSDDFGRVTLDDLQTHKSHTFTREGDKITIKTEDFG